MIDFVFTIWLSGVIPANYQRCIDSLFSIYSHAVIVREWGDCPYPRTGDDRRDSEKLRRWVLSKRKEALYSDADVFHEKELSFDRADKPWFGEDAKGVSQWLCYHKGCGEFFVRKNYCISTGNSYRIKDGFIHHGFTMNSTSIKERANETHSNDSDSEGQ